MQRQGIEEPSSIYVPAEGVASVPQSLVLQTTAVATDGAPL